MFRIEIIYFVKGSVSKRKATVLAENLQAAEKKVKEMDPEYNGICGVSAREMPKSK